MSALETVQSIWPFVQPIWGFCGRFNRSGYTARSVCPFFAGLRVQFIWVHECLVELGTWPFEGRSVSVLYVDTSAWGKLLVEEDGSAGFESFVREALDRGDALVSSELLTTELYRLAVRVGAPAASVTALLSVLHLSLPTRAVFRAAGLLGGRVRSLDAIHVASALDLDADAFVSYDWRRLETAEAAEAAGLLTSPPR